ncbi:MAG TPA: hypothetical protein VHX11_05720 [Acidobacteriaceae bacterium]|nr:hypothetical protein [Acidobacteriaceae bacterium]
MKAIAAQGALGRKRENSVEIAIAGKDSDFKLLFGDKITRPHHLKTQWLVRHHGLSLSRGANGIRKQMDPSPCQAFGKCLSASLFFGRHHSRF